MNSLLLVQPWLWFFACRPLSTSRISILRCVFPVIPVATTQPALGWVARQNGSVVHLTTHDAGRTGSCHADNSRWSQRHSPVKPTTPAPVRKALSDNGKSSSHSMASLVAIARSHVKKKTPYSVIETALYRESLICTSMELKCITINRSMLSRKITYFSHMPVVLQLYNQTWI